MVGSCVLLLHKEERRTSWICRLIVLARPPPSATAFKPFPVGATLHSQLVCRSVVVDFLGLAVLPIMPLSLKCAVTAAACFRRPPPHAMAKGHGILLSLLLAVTQLLPPVALALSSPLCNSGGQAWVTQYPYRNPLYPGADLYCESWSCMLPPGNCHAEAWMQQTGMCKVTALAFYWLK